MVRNPMLRSLMFWDYKIPITIFSKRGNGTIVQRDVARRVKKQDGSFIYELKARGEIKAPEIADLTADGQLFLYEREYNQFTPLVVDAEEAKLKTITMDDTQFIAYNMRQSKELYKNPKGLTAVLQMVLPIIIIGILIVGGLLIFDSVSKGVANVQGQNLKIAEQQNQMLISIDNLLVKTGVANATTNSTPIRW